jgi:hypothetical protein
MVWLKRIGIVLGVFLVMLVSAYFISRNALLHYVVNQKVKTISEKYDIDISFKDVAFKGCNTVSISNLQIKMDTNDTFFRSSRIDVSVKLLPALLHKIRLSSVMMQEVHISLMKKDSIWNFSRFLHRSRFSNTEVINKNRDFDDIARSITSSFFASVPANLQFKNFSIDVRTDTSRSTIKIGNLKKSGADFFADINCLERGSINFWTISGKVEPRNKMLHIALKEANRSHLRIPVIKSLYNADCLIDSAFLTLTSGSSSGRYMLCIDGRIHNLAVNQPKLTTKEVKVGFGRIFLKTYTGSNFFEVDSSSLMELNRFAIQPYFRYEKDAQKRITFKILPKEFRANDFFASLPSGLFTSFEGMLASGTMRYQLNFYADMAKPDELIFDSRLESKDIRIIKYGTENFSRINGPFMHQVYDKGRYIKSIWIGSQNPDFTPIAEVPQTLIYSIFTAEDPDFYTNSGFNKEAFRKAIITNIKDGRFARGGSTLTMQLVKNVFLTNKKTVTRKAEEALIVWLLDREKIVSKSRLLEIYLNIAEWGPGIYGIKQASAFYFNKRPSALNLSECIYLTSLIPHPKAFRYSFDKTGKLRPFMASYYHLISGLLLSRGHITALDTVGLRPDVHLTGPARMFFAKADSTASDSIMVSSEDEDEL